MADCTGTTPVSTKIDASMTRFLDTEANRLGVTKAELLRRLLDFYRESIDAETTCPDCNAAITILLDA